MNYVFAILFLILGPQAWAAQPPCWPKQIGSTGSDYKRGETETTRWIAWTCVVKGKPVIYGAVALKTYVLKEPDTAGIKSPIKVAQLFWDANTKTDPKDPALAPGWAAINQAFP